MKASELRIGNWVEHNGKQAQIIELFGIKHKPEWDACRTSGSGDKQFFTFELKPIVITEEHLNKMGFVVNKPDYPHYDWHFQTNEIDGLRIVKFRNTLTGEINTWCNIEIADSYVEIYVEHVHHLQNVWVAISNKELELK